MVIHAIIIFLVLFLVSAFLIFFTNYVKNINKELQAKQRYLYIQNNTKVVPKSACISYILFLLLLSMVISIAIAPEDLSFRKVKTLANLNNIITTNSLENEDLLDQKVCKLICNITGETDLTVEKGSDIYYIKENKLLKIELTESLKTEIYTFDEEYRVKLFCLVEDTFLIVLEKSCCDSIIYLFDEDFNILKELYFTCKIGKAYLQKNELIVVGCKEVNKNSSYEITIKDEKDTDYIIEIGDMYYTSNSIIKKNLLIFKFNIKNSLYRARTVLVYDFVYEFVEGKNFFYIINASLHGENVRYFTIVIDYNFSSFKRNNDVKIVGMAYSFNHLEENIIQIQTLAVKNGKNIIKKISISQNFKIKEIEILELEKNKVIVEKFNKAFLIDTELKKMLGHGEIYGGKFVSKTNLLGDNLYRRIFDNYLVEICETDYHYLIRKINLLTNKEVSYSFGKINVLDIESKIKEGFIGGVIFRLNDDTIKIIIFKENSEEDISLDAIDEIIIFTKNYILVENEETLIYNYLGEHLKTINK